MHSKKLINKVRKLNGTLKSYKKVAILLKIVLMLVWNMTNTNYGRVDSNTKVE